MNMRVKFKIYKQSRWWRMVGSLGVCTILVVFPCVMTKCFISKLAWDNRLGHPANQALNSLNGLLNFDSEPLPPCENCHKAKQTHDSFPSRDHITNNLGELIHLDL